MIITHNREWFVAALLGGIYLCALPTFTYGGRDLVAMLQVGMIMIMIIIIIFITIIRRPLVVSRGWRGVKALPLVHLYS